MSRDSAELWPSGSAPLGFDFRYPVPKWQWFGTQIASFVAPKLTKTAYFAKFFSLTEAEVKKTFSLGLFPEKKLVPHSLG